MINPPLDTPQAITADVASRSGVIVFMCTGQLFTDGLPLAVVTKRVGTPDAPEPRLHPAINGLLAWLCAKELIKSGTVQARDGKQIYLRIDLSEADPGGETALLFEKVIEVIVGLDSFSYNAQPWLGTMDDLVEEGKSMSEGGLSHSDAVQQARLIVLDGLLNAFNNALKNVP